MIRRAIILRRNGELVFGREYEEEGPSEVSSVPAYVKACLVLLASSQATKPMHPYILEHGKTVWAYCLFETFAIAVEASHDEPIEWLGRRMVSLGREIAHHCGRVLSTWSGQMPADDGLADVTDRYMHFGAGDLSEDSLRQVEDLVNRALAEQDVAYVGVFDAVAEMLAGNVPEEHVTFLRERITRGSARPEIDLVPIVVEIDGYAVQLIRVRSLTVVASPYPEGSTMKAARVVADLAEAINDLIRN